MSQRVTKCTVCGQAGHTRIHCLVMCGSCSGDSRNCDCEQPPAKKQKTKKGKRAAEKEQPQVAAAAEKKCSLNNAYRLAGTARSTIRDFLGIAELKIANEVTYQSTLERLGDPKLAVKRIEQECRRQLGGLLPLVKRLRVSKKLLPLALEDAFYS